MLNCSIKRCCAKIQLPTEYNCQLVHIALHVIAYLLSAIFGLLPFLFISIHFQFLSMANNLDSVGTMVTLSINSAILPKESGQVFIVSEQQS